jgi:Cof subfamily protein (haloacid dehalogenase superfamily)
VTHLTFAPSSSIHLIAIDIDGTLLDGSGNLPPRNKRAVRRAVSAGIEIVLVTGRAFHHARPVANALSQNINLIVNNGALTKNLHGETFCRRLIPRETAMSIIAMTNTRRYGVAIIFDRDDEKQYAYEGIDWTHPQRNWYYERYRTVITKISPIESALTEDPVQIAFNGSVDEMRSLARNFNQSPISQDVTITLTEYESRNFSLLDIIGRNWSKGAALAKWAARLEIDSANVMAIGDNLNDIEMLEFAGLPIVMGNAVDALTNRGWLATATHDNCGLAKAIEPLIKKGE